jgi:hypothetical protein
MSSVPVQLLIYVINVPVCSEAPVLIPLTGCLQVTVGISMSFNIFAVNLCNPNVTAIMDIVVIHSGTADIQIGGLTNSSTNASLVYKILTWIPQGDEVGPQQLCMIAYTR